MVPMSMAALSGYLYCTQKMIAGRFIKRSVKLYTITLIATLIQRRVHKIKLSDDIGYCISVHAHARRLMNHFITISVNLET